MRISPMLPLLLAISTLLTACDYSADGVEQLNAIPFGGTNDVNIAAMVANPVDLVRGRGDTPASGKAAEAPIQRQDADHAKALLTPGQGAGGGGATGG